MIKPYCITTFYYKIEPPIVVSDSSLYWALDLAQRLISRQSDDHIVKYAELIHYDGATTIIPGNEEGLELIKILQTFS